MSEPTARGRDGSVQIGEPSVTRFADLTALSNAAADDFVALAAAAVAARGRFDVALSGGSTPRRLFELLAARGADAVPWARVELWWGDERTVGPDHADSNYRMAREALILPLGIDEARVHRMRGEIAPEAAALEYERALLAALGEPPVLDLVLLGMGPDGHTASLFPGSVALGDVGRWVVANPVDSPLTKGPTTRLTFTARTIGSARHTRFLVGGADKAAALHAVLEGPRDHHRYPSQLISGADVRWFVDTAAAGQLAS